MQLVNYPPLPKVPGDKYLERSLALLRKVKQDAPDVRKLRRWVRSEGFYDKPTFLELLAFLGIREGDSGFQVGGIGARLLAEMDPEAQQDMLFEHVAEQNEILAKYVFDALTERLYSTSELYRMLTSYVYPGKYIDLPQFQNWLNWVSTTGRCRVLGIRWATGVRYEASAPYIAGIDVDDILDEEAEEALLAEQGGAEPVVEAAASEPAPSPTPAAAEPETAAEEEIDLPDATPSVGWEPPEDDDSLFEEEPALHTIAGMGVVPDMLPTPAAPAASAPQLVYAPTLIEARLLDPAPQLAALAAGAPLERVRAAMQGADAPDPEALLAELSPAQEQVARNVAELLAWWGEVSDRPLVRADQHGLMPFGEGGWEDGTRGKFLFRLACLAVNVCRRTDGDVAFGALDQAGFFSAIYDRPGAVEQVVDELFEQGLGGRVDLFENLHLYVLLARSLRGSEAFCAALADLGTEEALSNLWQRLAAYQMDTECLWVARELSMFGLLRQEELRTLRVVPTPEARQAGFRLGLLPSARAASLPALVAQSRTLTTLIAPELEGPLVALWRAYGDRPPRRFWTR